MKKLILSFLLLSLSAFVFGQSITLDPKTTSPAGLQVTSDFALRKQKRETVNGGWTNYPRDNSSLIIFEGGGSLSGIADGQDGVVVYVFNGNPTGPTATGNLVIQNENVSSAAINQILTPNGTDFPVGKGGVAMVYDGSKQRWRVATPDQTGGGGSFSGWGLTGNGGTNPTSNFIGTTDVQPLVLKTNNVENMRILSSGNVGIGSSNPNAKLDLNGDFSLTKRRLLTSLGIQNALDRQGASRILIDVNGTVTLNGIAGGVDGLMIFLYTGSFTKLTINNLDVSALSVDRIATHTGTQVTITGRGGVSLIYDSGTGNWRVIGFADENSAWNSMGNSGTNPATHFIGTTDNQGFVLKTNNLERMRVLSSGEVGIGTNSPSSKLHLANTSITTTPDPTSLLTLENNGNLGLSMLSGSTNASRIYFGSSLGNIKGRIQYIPTGNYMDFFTNDLNRMTIDGAGDVGIGTTSPDAKLEVAGTYAISGKTNMTGNQNNYNLGGKSVIHVSGGGVYTLTGIAGGIDGMIVHIYVSISTDLILADVSASSLAANRIVTGSNADLTISQGGGATLIYDADASIWRLIGFKQ